MFEQIYSNIDKYLSDFARGAVQYSTMLVGIKLCMDSGKLAGAPLTDLFKVFDCRNHELLIAKLEAYCFDLSSLKYIYSYLSIYQIGNIVLK